MEIRDGGRTHCMPLPLPQSVRIQNLAMQPLPSAGYRSQVQSVQKEHMQIPIGCARRDWVMTGLPQPASTPYGVSGSSQPPSESRRRNLGHAVATVEPVSAQVEKW